MVRWQHTAGRSRERDHLWRGDGSLSSGVEVGMERKREPWELEKGLWPHCAWTRPMERTQFFFPFSMTWYVTTNKMSALLANYNRGETINTPCQALWGPRRSEESLTQWHSRRCSMDRERWKTKTRFATQSQNCTGLPCLFAQHLTTHEAGLGKLRGLWRETDLKFSPVGLLTSQ